MPLVDYGDELDVIVPDNAAGPSVENVHYIEPVCPTRAKRRPRPDLIVLYKLQQQDLNRGMQQGEVPQQKAETPPEKSASQVEERPSSSKHQLRDTHSDDEHETGPKPKRRRRVHNKQKN